MTDCPHTNQPCNPECLCKEHPLVERALDADAYVTVQQYVPASSPDEEDREDGEGVIFIFNASELEDFVVDMSNTVQQLLTPTRSELFVMVGALTEGEHLALEKVLGVMRRKANAALKCTQE